MGRSVFANSRNFSHKGSGDKSLCTAPDVCKTPIGTSTPPIPYFVVSQVTKLADGSSTVSIEGNPTSLAGSSHSKCSGDEPGTAKGVCSSKTTDETKFTSYSFDVKCDGEGVVRAFDTSTMNKVNTIGMVLGSVTSPSIIVDEQVDPWEPEEVPPWLKIKANYDDPWNTPIPAENVKVTVNGEVVAEDITLNEGEGTNTIAYLSDEASSTADEPGVTVLTDIPAGQAVVEIVRESGIEQDISDQRASIEALLDGAYRATVKDMKGFQEQWDDYGYASVLLSLQYGTAEGTIGWVKDQGDLFEAEIWQSLGNTISDATAAAFDYASDYASDTYDNIVTSANEASDWADENSENLSNWTWWSKKVQDGVDEAYAAGGELLDSTQEHIDNAMDFIGESIEIANKLIKHQEAILALPEHIAAGRADQVELFIDNALMDIHPEIAQEIKNNPNFHLVLELIADHDAALTFIAYLQLIFEAVPPNFYSHMVGKGGAYVAIELILTILLAFLSAGSGAAARVGMLAAKFAAMSSKAAKVAKTIKRAEAALNAFVKNIEDIEKAIEKLTDLSRLLAKAKRGGIVSKTRTRKTVTIKKKNKQRDKKCRICGQTEHTTPRSLNGEIKYV
ncbi:MAG: hypothetical protein COA42_03040 [Alteromonadaceae bacterium]|nr:MAG: hypothetical protein COA42_03040 [Alteromonadaceae bacterium]